MNGTEEELLEALKNTLFDKKERKSHFSSTLQKDVTQRGRPKHKDSLYGTKGPLALYTHRNCFFPWLWVGAARGWFLPRMEESQK